MAVWKVSFVVKDSDHPGGIVNFDHSPALGEQIQIGGDTFEVLEVFELMPPKGEFHYLHVTCRVVGPSK